MVSQDDIRAIASRLPGAVEGEGQFGFSVPVKGKPKGFVWSWRERVDPKKAKVINDGVVAVLVRNLEIKEMLLSMGHPAYFTEPHYNGFPAILVRLDTVEFSDLEELLVEAWRCKASPELIRQYEAAQA